MSRIRRVLQGALEPNPNRPLYVGKEPQPMPGKSMRRDGYEVLARRVPGGLPGDIEDYHGERDDPFAPTRFPD